MHNKTVAGVCDPGRELIRAGLIEASYSGTRIGNIGRWHAAGFALSSTLKSM
jgi:hypothetical protein